MLRPFAYFAGIVTLSLTAVACGGAPTDDGVETSAAGLTETFDEAGIDAQVLQVWTPGRLFPQAVQPWFGPRPGDASVVAAAACEVLETSTWSHYDNTRVDCTKAFASAVPFDVTGAAGPVMTPIRFTVTKDQSGGGVYVDPDYCNYVEVRVVARDAAVADPSFSGIGFWTSKGDSFAPKAALQEVGKTRLASGDAATVYRFTGISTCISSAHNSTSGNMYQTFSFKPYAAYDVPQSSGDVKRYRVWERIQGNHTIGRSSPGYRPAVDATSFDRQGELLAR